MRFHLHEAPEVVTLVDLEGRMVGARGSGRGGESVFSADNRWSLVLIEHQQESPRWGEVKKETSFCANSSAVIQHGHGSAQESGSSVKEQRGCEVALGQAPLWTGLVSWDLLASALVQRGVIGLSFSVFQRQLGDVLFGLQGKSKVRSPSQRELTYTSLTLKSANSS